MSSYNLMFLKWRLDMGLTFDGIIELKTDISPRALTPDSHHLNNESRIIAPLFTVKAPLIKTDDMATEREGAGRGEEDEGKNGTENDTFLASLYCWCQHSVKHAFC